MMLIEQIIKTILFEQREVPGKISTDTPSNFAIAKKAGAVVSFNLKLSDAKGLTDDQIRKAIAGTLNGNPTTGPSSKYASGEYIYLISSPKPGNRLKFKVWLIDLKKLRDLAVPLNDIDKTKDYFESGPPSIDFNNFKIGRSIIASVGDMQRWFSILKQRAVEQNIKLTLPNIYKIDKQETEPNLSQYQTKLVNITDENSAEFTFLPNFRGQAKISFSPENGREIITPINGSISIIQTDLNEPKRGYFEGEFQNGLPYKGKLVYYQLGSNTDIYSIWEGEVTSTARTETKPDGTEEQNFNIKRKEGAGKETFKYVAPLDYPYTAQWADAKYGINRIYYSSPESKLVYFVDETSIPPTWLKVNKQEFERYIDNSTSAQAQILNDATFNAAPEEIEMLNKKYPNAIVDIASIQSSNPIQLPTEEPAEEPSVVTPVVPSPAKKKAKGTAVKFKTPSAKIPLYIYKNGSFIRSTKSGREFYTPANNSIACKYMGISTSGEYTDLLFPNGSRFWVKTDTLK